MCTAATYKTKDFYIGTLLDTLDDLADAVNHALAACRLPLRSRQDIRRFLGNGVRSLVTQSAAPMADADMTERALTLFRAYYLEHSMDKTKPYDGILPLLDALKAHGVRTAIVSNTFPIRANSTPTSDSIFCATTGSAYRAFVRESES